MSSRGRRHPIGIPKKEHWGPRDPSEFQKRAIRSLEHPGGMAAGPEMPNWGEDREGGLALIRVEAVQSLKKRQLGSPVGKQFWIFMLCSIILPAILYIKSNFFEHLSYIFYGLSIISLIGLFLFGQTISGATSWYLIGGFSLQPSEFAKITTAMVVALNLSSIQTDMKKKRDLLCLLIFLVMQKE